MARFKYSDAKKYGGQGGAGFFQLDDDGDVGHIRFLYNDPDECEAVSVHPIKIRGKKKEQYIDCLRQEGDPKSACPFCREGMYCQVRLIMPIFNEDSGNSQIWERGKSYVDRIGAAIEKNQDGGIVSHIFEVERIGEAGDQRTQYRIKVIDQDDAVLEDFDIPEIYGRLIWEKTPEEMEYYLEHKEFPDDEDDEDERPSRRHASSGSKGRRDYDEDDDYEDDDEDEAPRRRGSRSGSRGSSSNRRGRRTPANTDDSERF